MLRTCSVVFALVLSACPAEAVAEDRVAAARKARLPAIRALFEGAGVAYPPGELYLRAFKWERTLEVWAGAAGEPLSLVTTYAICGESGTLGPKRRLGDGQIPEGFYRVVRFNPQSVAHLSFKLDYPNASDALLGARGKLGGNIFVHGTCVSVGCIAIDDAPIEELYVMTLDTWRAGRRHLPVHVFPRRLDVEGLRSLESLAGEDESLASF